METKNLFLFLANAIVCMMKVSGYSDTYRGAVVEYKPVDLASEEDSVNKNVENYEAFIKEAESKKVDIIVFPEGGLFTKSEKTASFIPDPVDLIVPCDDSNFKPWEAVKKLSCASKNSKIYSVVNLLEKRKYGSGEKDFYLYNTNVVFDRKGAVIARYAKYNLFDELNKNRTEDPEIVFFDTDFGVRFGTFVCFDILFQTPTLRLVRQYRITDFVFTTFWFSELPFLTALQVQRGWAESNNVNLLASGVNNAESGSGGSGIYNGKFGDLVKTFSATEIRKLLIADIPHIESCNTVSVGNRHVNESIRNSVATTREVIQKKKPTGDFELLKDQIELFESEVIKTEKPFEKKICSFRNFCCDFFVDVDEIHPDAKNYTYRAVVFNGIRKFGREFRGGTQVCGVILCNGPDLLSCTDRVKRIPRLFHFKEIRITGSFRSRNSFQMPSTLTDGELLEPLSADKYEFTKEEKKKSIEVTLDLLWPVIDLHTFAIWGRDFTRDNEPEIPTGSAGMFVSVPALVVTFVGFLVFTR